MKLHHLLLPLALSVALPAGAQTTPTASTVKTYMYFDLVRDWDVGGGVEFDAGDHTLDTNTTTPGLFQSIYGPISGNTISRTAFINAVATAYDQGRGGVINFEDAYRSFDTEDWIHPTAGVITRANAANALRTNGPASITINRGANWWFEGTYSGSPWGAYKGKQTSAFDGTGPSGPDRANYSEVFFMETQGPSTSHNILGQKAFGFTTSWDLVFDPADQIIIIGFAYINWNNFQSQQDTTKDYANYPNIHATASFTNGVDSLTQMAVGLSQYSGTSMPIQNEYYFGFQAPDGYFLESLKVYTIGNNNRAFGLIDDLGYVIVPEPRVYALLVGLAALGLVWLRRRGG